MLSDRSRQALLDIRDNIVLAQAFIAGLGEDDLSVDRKSFYAVTRCLEIISEALSQPQRRPQVQASRSALGADRWRRKHLPSPV
jgi:uncharacterized protein with HEPN domain